MASIHLLASNSFREELLSISCFLMSTDLKSLWPAISMTIAVSLYSIKFGFVTWFSKHELDKACSLERGSVFLLISHRLQFRFSCFKFVYKHWCRVKEHLKFRLTESYKLLHYHSEKGTVTTAANIHVCKYDHSIKWDILFFYEKNGRFNLCTSVFRFAPMHRRSVLLLHNSLACHSLHFYLI